MIAKDDHPDYERLKNIPSIYYKNWLEKHGKEIAGSNVLDFGCGAGLTTVGLSLYCHAKSVVGMDIGRDFERVTNHLHEIDDRIEVPNNVLFKQVEPCGDLGENHFDIIVSWSVLEHVSQQFLLIQLEKLKSALKSDGLCVFQMAPLYYSAWGSHLFSGLEPWHHLKHQTNILREKVRAAAGSDARFHDLWNCYETLNRCTLSDFRENLTLAGFAIVDEYITYNDEIPE